MEKIIQKLKIKLNNKLEGTEFKYWHYILYMCFALTCFYFIGRYFDSEKNRLNKELYLTSFNSVIESKVESDKNASHIRIKNIKEIIHFKPYLTQENNGKIYPDKLATIGDSIFKKPNSNEINIIHNNQLYVYPFVIYDDSLKKLLKIVD